MILRLPHGETDENKRYSFPDPDDEGNIDALWTMRYGEPTRAQVLRALSLAQAYMALTTYELGQEHCVGKLRDIWRARRASQEAPHGTETGGGA